MAALRAVVHKPREWSIRISAATARLRQATSMALAFRSVAAATTVSSLVALVWARQWAVNNSTEGDAEQARLAESTLAVLIVLLCILVAGLIVRRWLPSWSAALALAASGAFITISSSAAGTMLLAIAIEPATDPGEFGRTLFRVAYAGTVLLSVAFALTTVLTYLSRRGQRVIAAGLMAVFIVTGWAYLVVGSSELNKCLLKDVEFPVRARHGCSGQ